MLTWRTAKFDRTASANVWASPPPYDVNDLDLIEYLHELNEGQLKQLYLDGVIEEAELDKLLDLKYSLV